MPNSAAPAVPVSSGGADSVRMRWVDVAKGLCILLVVLHHVVGKHLPEVLPMVEPYSPVAGWWMAADAVFKPMRMPLFFVLSGMFAAGALRRPWPRVLARKVATPYWVYAVWLTVHVVVFAAVATRIETHRPPVGLEVLWHLVLAATGLWYLYALSVYFVLAKALSGLPAGLVVGVAAVVSGAASYLPVTGVNRIAVLQCFVFFVVGAYFPRLLSAMPVLSRRRVAVLAAGYGGVAAVGSLVGVERSVTMLALAVFAVPLGVQAAMALDRGPIADRLASLGRQTLPVYVLHMPLLGLVHQVLTSLPYRRRVYGTGSPLTWGDVGWSAAAVVYPLVVVAALVAVCLAAHRRAAGSGLRYLFTLPPTVAAALDRIEVVPAQAGAGRFGTAGSSSQTGPRRAAGGSWQDFSRQR